jgi:hypothetical protein
LNSVVAQLLGDTDGFDWVSTLSCRRDLPRRIAQMMA